MKTAVFLDLDGTLWESEHIPPSALEAIEKARSCGHLIFANTGRARSSGYPPLKDLPLDGYVFSAGSEIWCDGKRLFYEPLNRAAAVEMKETFDRLDLGYAAEGSKETYANEKDREFLRKHIGVNRISNTFLSLPDPAEMKPDDFDHIMKYSVQVEDLRDIEGLIKKYNLTFTPFAMRVDGLQTGELTQSHLSKATAMEEVRRMFGGNLRTVALGDSENDIPMLHAADLGIAMGNGTEDAKAAADWITSSIDADGLKNAFEYAGLFEPAC